MKSRTDWDDLNLFAAVARNGSLARSAGELGVSVATLSRRLRGLEAHLGRRLFLHGKSGYSLTAEGRALWERTKTMEAAAVQIDLWAAAATGRVPVRITAGTWTAMHLSERLIDFWSPEAEWLPELIYCEVPMDIARREVDIGLRNSRPDQPWLAGRRIGETRIAVYAKDESVTGWIGMALDAAQTRSARWIEANHGPRIVTRSNMPLFSYQMARAGIGRVVLPVEVGDGAPGLTRLSDPIEELTSERWLVSHQDARHEPPIRAALDALAAFFIDDARTAASGPLEPEQARA